MDTDSISLAELENSLAEIKNAHLTKLLNNYSGISREDLETRITATHRDQLALEIGGDWESLAIFIGVPPDDVDDIKEECRKPLDRRLAMMRRWHKLWGSEATYLRLIKGLRQIGRRDLIDRLMYFYSRCKYGFTDDQLKGSSRTREFCGLVMEQLRSIPTLKMFLVCLFIMSLYLVSSPFGTKVNNYNIITNTETSNHTFTSYHIVRPNSKGGSSRNFSHCTVPENDMPIIYPLFVGREKDTHQILLRVARTHIININGAPGFGKSTLAIHVGYEIFKSGTSIRYINMEDKVFTVMSQPHKQGEKPAPKFSSNTNVPQAQTVSTSLVEGNKYSLVVPIGQKSLISTGENLFEELQRWSKKLWCMSILILDNCDDMLASSARHKFLKFIDTLVKISHYKLHIIVVSHEKLFYIDNFDCWTVRELNLSASVQLLDKIAPAIDNETLTAAAELVEGCPLALRIIGKLLDIHGAQIVHRLKKELLSTLNKASVIEKRFGVIMDVAFNRLGLLKDCGYALSLFPASFDEQAGIAIVQKECLELYLKHSLINDYYVGFNYRYKMHRVIKEYLQNKVSITDSTNFKLRFRKHFETVVFTYAMKQEMDDAEKYTLSLEEPNFYYLREMILIEVCSSPEELAIMAFLFDRNLVQLEGYYIYYIKMIHKICPLINPKLCGQVYTHIVNHLYHQCKYEISTTYFQSFFASPPFEYFQCEVVSYLQSLYTAELLQLSEDITSYMQLDCSYMQRGDSLFGFDHILLFQPKYVIMVVVISYFSLSFQEKIFKLITPMILLYDLTSLITDIAAPNIRRLAISLKCLCHLAIIYFSSELIVEVIYKRKPSFRRDGIFLGSLIALCIMDHYCTQIQLSYCCQFIPMCI